MLKKGGIAVLVLMFIGLGLAGVYSVDSGEENVYHNSTSITVIGYRSNWPFEKTWGSAPEFSRFGSPGKV